MKKPQFGKCVSVINDKEDVNKLGMADVASGFCCPIFPVSAKDGRGIDLLRKFLFRIPASIARTQMTEKVIQHSSIKQKLVIDSKYFSKTHGIVIGGTVLDGTIKVGDVMMLGPDKGGLFSEVKVFGIHEERVEL